MQRAHSTREYTIIFHHTGSEGSIQSWASSLSLDSQTDETAAEAIEYMKNFVATLFSDSNAITREQKAAFGKYAQVRIILVF
jgi:hypothetical protein